MAGPDDLLLFLVHHWASDESVFPTEDDRHDVATVMLFQAYTGGRPAEFVHASKGKASEDPLGERVEADKNAHPREPTHANHDEDSDADIDGNDSNADDGLRSDDEMIFDSDDDRSDDGTADKHIDKYGSDSGYNSDRTDVTMTEDTNKSYTAEIDECGQPLRQNLDAAKPSEFEEVKREYKALCYEDICLWIVQNPKRGERDLLAMEVHLRHHKGVDNKPKPYVALPRYLEPWLTQPS